MDRRLSSEDEIELIDVNSESSVVRVEGDRRHHFIDRRKQGVIDPESRLELLDGETRVGQPDSTYLAGRLGMRRSNRKVGWRLICLMGLGIISLTSTILSVVSLIALERERLSRPRPLRERMVSRIAFGSCTAYDYSSQPVWVHGVIPSDPDVWIWVGDMAYLDVPRVNCAALPSHPHCNCTNDWLHQSPYSCMSGDVDHALSRIQAQLSNPDYAQFLSFMCPGHRAKGLHPPTGPDPDICPRLILGTYDDHDYSWNNGNKRLPRKDDIKQIFLDAIGEPNTSPRRNRGRGIEWKYTLNAANPRRQIEVFLLDERYNRDTLPCDVRREYCKEVLDFHPQHTRRAWCDDFLNGGDLGKGSCCNKDDDIYHGWCLQEVNKKNSLYTEACDPRSPLFGTRSLVVDSRGILVEASGSDLLDGRAESSFCDVLGREQRLWLREALGKSNAPLKLIISSSVILGNLQPQMCDWDDEGISSTCKCSGDDWECYKPAQLHLLHLLSQTPGCVVLLTGDYHYSDIRVLRPQQELASMFYNGLDPPYPLYQVMASGMTTSTGQNFSCDDTRKDTTGLREHGECRFVTGPSFGMIQVQWEDADPTVRLQVRDGETGSVSLESNLTLGSCYSP